MTTEHTPGPWTNNRNQVYAERGNGSTLAYIYSNDADARLIAAAPDLLATLRDLVRRIERDNLHTTHGVQIRDARAAIEQAVYG